MARGIYTTSTITTHDLWHSRTPTTASTTSSTSEGIAGIMRKSIFGSVRDRLSRKNSDESQKSPASSSPANTTAARGRSDNNPFASYSSEPTRRPLAPINEPPPAYTPSPTMQSGPTVPAGEIGGNGGLLAGNARGVSPAPSTSSALSTAEDPYAFLSTFDTIFVIDDSGSMAGRSWREVKEALRTITPICTAHDKDGIDVYFLNYRSRNPGDVRNNRTSGGHNNVTNPEEVERIFNTVRPSGGTPTGTRIHQILKPYLNRLSTPGIDMDSIKPINMIVITDGMASDDVESVLVAAAKKLDKLEAPMSQVGVQFFQVGNDREAREALKALDDDLGEIVQGGLRDIVDTVTWEASGTGAAPGLTAEGILKTVLGAVVRRIDRKQIGTGPPASGRRR